MLFHPSRSDSFAHKQRSINVLRSLCAIKSAQRVFFSWFHTLSQVSDNVFLTSCSTVLDCWVLFCVLCLEKSIRIAPASLSSPTSVIAEEILYTRVFRLLLMIVFSLIVTVDSLSHLVTRNVSQHCAQCLG